MSGKARYSRHELREAVFKILFAKEFDKEADPADFYIIFTEDTDQIDNEYVKTAFVGITEKLNEIDAEIETYSSKWKISRMSTASRCALRLSVYEMVYTDVPPKVSINEAVEIVKAYDDESAPAFVNGILNKIARERGFIENTSTDIEA